MPDHTIHLTEADRALIERVRAERGLSTLEEAARWLVQTRLRRTMRTATGRGRAPYLVAPRRAAL